MGRNENPQFIVWHSIHAGMNIGAGKNSLRPSENEALPMAVIILKKH